MTGWSLPKVAVEELVNWSEKDQMKILATSDIHGNKALIYLVLQIIRKENIDALIIAGDIAPKGFYQQGFYMSF